MPRPDKHLPKNQKTTKNGFTLIEVLVSAVLIIIIAGATLTLINTSTRTRLLTFRNLLNVDQANVQVSIMTRELRNIQFGENAAYPLAVAEDQEIVFYSDVDYDGQSERVRYSLNGTNFVKGIIEPVGHPATYPTANEKVKVLSQDVRNGNTPIFYYYNGDWPADTINNPLSKPVRLSDTKIMKVYLRLNTQNDPDSDFIIESYSQLRMLKENL
jgi:prepilin-type N-terminal cleavage/methylation domain-containing protein